MVRRTTQSLAWLTLLIAPVLGGWQRLDRNYLAAWNGAGWDLPAWLLVRLPLGDAPRRAYEASQFVGGGVGVEYLELPLIDPLASLVAQLGHADWSMWVVLGWVLPVGLALIGGRVFCGWFCPYGVLARGLEFLLERLPWQPPRFRVPERRILRATILLGTLILGIAGAQLALYLLLPHLLVQQAVYGMWLMGGGGAALGALVGLVGAGVVFGPTVYCAAVCPTGTALAAAGAARRVRLQIAEIASCGHNCDLCDRGCWLDLRPSRGTPGPDCDLCARCTEVCPKDNLVITTARRSLVPESGPTRDATDPLTQPPPVVLRVSAAGGGRFRRAWLVGTLATTACCSPPPPEIDPAKPSLLLEAHHELELAQVSVAVVDYTGVRFAPDDANDLQGTEVSIYIARGDRGEPDERGSLPPREVYTGAIRLVVSDDQTTRPLAFDGPNSPTSTPHRTIYRRIVRPALKPGTTLTLEPIPGWLTTPKQWTIASPRPRGAAWRVLGYALATALLFGGLISLALVPFRRPTAGSSDSSSPSRRPSTAQTDPEPPRR
ncbi:MAG: 4Fe-4S binding protein [Myxococcales bacterium FL481]|nr:MAG: 4Fe-4S binding protein [Myxococcales bacterium FL481]